jgi:hypothetical protein
VHGKASSGRHWTTLSTNLPWSFSRRIIFLPRIDSHLLVSTSRSSFGYELIETANGRLATRLGSGRPRTPTENSQIAAIVEIGLTIAGPLDNPGKPSRRSSTNAKFINLAIFHEVASVRGQVCSIDIPSGGGPLLVVRILFSRTLTSSNVFRQGSLLAGREVSIRL